MGQTKDSWQADGGLKAGSAGTLITKIEKGTVSVTVSALAAGAEEDIDVTVTGAVAGDAVMVNPTEAAAETGLSVAAAWISAADTLSIRASPISLRLN